MNAGSLRVPRSARVYTILLALIFVVAAHTGAPAQLRITYEPMLTKGPARAPVTLVEFSDFQ